MIFKRIFCKHNFKSDGKEKLIGITLNWALNPTKEYKDVYNCEKCGLKKQKDIFILMIIYNKNERNV